MNKPTTPVGRLLTAMVTPFRDDLSVDLDGAARLAQHLVETGSDGIVVTGTTGEVPTLSYEEKIELYKVVKRTVPGTAAVVAGTGNYSTEESIHLTRAAERAGVDAIMAVVPYYNNPPQEGLYRHFQAIAAATALPLIVYNVPGAIANQNVAWVNRDACASNRHLEVGFHWMGGDGGRRFDRAEYGRGLAAELSPKRTRGLGRQIRARETRGASPWSHSGGSTPSSLMSSRPWFPRWGRRGRLRCSA